MHVIHQKIEGRGFVVNNGVNDGPALNLLATLGEAAVSELSLFQNTVRR